MVSKPLDLGREQIFFFFKVHSNKILRYTNHNNLFYFKHYVTQSIINIQLTYYFI